MKTRILKMSMRTLAVLMLVALVADTVAAVVPEEVDGRGDNAQTVDAWGKLGAGLAVGLAGIGAGISQGNIGAAAVGMLAEDPGRFGHAIIFTALPESIVILGLLPLFM
ncbi:MAG: hypothetical protein QGF72_02185 [Candidatus Poseidoniaceae archaeon]|jgi:V/A-type H+-transporting ATPase subunit K|nr:hypothetical protein [Candidatus Poseidoniaceae archaeon]